MFYRQLACTQYSTSRQQNRNNLPGFSPTRSLLRRSIFVFPRLILRNKEKKSGLFVVCVVFDTIKLKFPSSLRSGCFFWGSASMQRSSSNRTSCNMDRTASTALRFAPPPPPSKRNPEQNKTKKSRYAGYSPDKTFRFLACEQNHLRENWGKDKKGKGRRRGGGARGGREKAGKINLFPFFEN